MEYSKRKHPLLRNLKDIKFAKSNDQIHAQFITDVGSLISTQICSIRPDENPEYYFSASVWKIRIEQKNVASLCIYESGFRSNCEIAAREVKTEMDKVMETEYANMKTTRKITWKEYIPKEFYMTGSMQLRTYEDEKNVELPDDGRFFMLIFDYVKKSSVNVQDSVLTNEFSAFLWKRGETMKSTDKTRSTKQNTQSHSTARLPVTFNQKIGAVVKPGAQAVATGAKAVATGVARGAKAVATGVVSGTKAVGQRLSPMLTPMVKRAKSRG